MTTEEVKPPEENNQNQEEKPAENSPSKKSLDIQRSLMEIDMERKERDAQQRFGIFQSHILPQ